MVRRSVLVVLVAPSLIACQTTPKQRLQGKWIGERAEHFSAVQSGRAAGWVSGASFEFKGSRVIISIPAESPREGTFEVASAKEDDLTLTFLRAEGAQDRVAFRFEQDGRLRWELGDGRSVVLRKVSD